MAKRFKPNQRKARKSFTRNAIKTHPRNVAPPPMRGGYRI